MVQFTQPLPEGRSTDQLLLWLGLHVNSVAIDNRHFRLHYTLWLSFYPIGGSSSFLIESKWKHTFSANIFHVLSSFVFPQEKNNMLNFIKLIKQFKKYESVGILNIWWKSLWELSPELACNRSFENLAQPLTSPWVFHLDSSFKCCFTQPSSNITDGVLLSSIFMSSVPGTTGMFP